MKLLAAGTLLFFLLGCTKSEEREVRSITISSDCEGNVIIMEFGLDHGTDNTEVKGPVP